MKKLFLTLTLIFTLAALSFSDLKAQQTQRPVYGIINIDVNGMRSLSPAQLGNLVRMHLEKMDTFQVIDRYDLLHLLRHDTVYRSNCFGKLCLTEAGRKIGADKMISGSVDLIGESMIVTLRRIDIKSGEIDKTAVRRFLNLPTEISDIMQIILNDLLDRPNPVEMMARLTEKDGFANAVNSPYHPKLSVDGPRLGFSAITGGNAEIIQRPLEQGGFAAYPVTFHFGYQFEKQYLNQGNFQALFEFIPLISGLEQGRFSPSFTIMNGIRNNKTGWEFAFGPSIALNRMAKVGLHSDGNYYTEKYWKENFGNTKPNAGFRYQLDSRGDAGLDPSFILAVGKTFRSGQLNIPINAFIVPKKNDFRFGISVGYNAKN